MDPYALCPGGTGKKVKFCCPDLVHELDKLDRMTEGEQRVAALEYVTKLSEKYPGRACLLSTRAALEASLGNFEQSAATLSDFREKHPENPLALAELAVMQASDGKAGEAISSMEKAVALCGEEIPERVYATCSAVADALIHLRHYSPARALLWFQSRLSDGKDTEALRQWASIEMAPAIPVFFKPPCELEAAPAGAPWKYEFDRALEPADRMQWHTAAEKFAALAPIAGKSAALWENLARLRQWIGDYAGAADALHKIATIDVPLDDAVEAEAGAILFEAFARSFEPSQAVAGPLDKLSLRFSLTNQSLLEQRFAAERQLVRLPVDPRMWQGAGSEAGENEPPPKAAFALLDRPLPASSDFGREQVPQALGSMLLFSRQTDRAERLELVASRCDAEKAKEHLRRIGGDALGEVSEEVLAVQPFGEITLHVPLHFPLDTPPDRRVEIFRQESQHRLLEDWPDTPLHMLDGKTPKQAASDPEMRIRLLATVLLMQTLADPGIGADAFARLREKLNLPAEQSIDPASVDLDRLPPLRLQRLQAEKLSDELLIRLYKRSRLPPQPLATELFAKEIVRRSSLAGRSEVLEAYNTLISMATDSASALKLIEAGRTAAQAAKRSAANYELAELRIRLERGEGHEAERLLKRIEGRHAKEPGVAEAMLQLLYQYGLIDEFGRPIADLRSQQPSIVVPGAESPSKILVPGGETSAAGESSKPRIWTPGMD